MIGQICGGGLTTASITLSLWGILALGFILHFIPKSIFDITLKRFSAFPPLTQAGCLFLFALLLKQIAVSEVVPFIYFQF